jgi:archaellum component FlaG (FlaF/FlaG flagellin family)
MGADTIATHLILFIAVIAIATGLLIGIKSFTDNAEVSIKEKGNALNKQIATSFAIEVINYDNIKNETIIYSRNTGTTNMKIEEIDVYLNGIRIPRNISNRTITIIEDTERFNTLDIWDSNEILMIIINKKLEQNSIHELIITTPYNVRISETFST